MFISQVPIDSNLPRAFGGCSCDCHRIPGVMHLLDCCFPTDNDLRNIINDPLLPVAYAIEKHIDPFSFIPIRMIIDPFGQGLLHNGSFYDNPYLDVKGKETEMRRWIDGKVKAITDKRNLQSV